MTYVEPSNKDQAPGDMEIIGVEDNKGNVIGQKQAEKPSEDENHR